MHGLIIKTNNRQSTPVVFRIGEAINNQAAFEAAIEAASSNIPFGGTCPSAAMERALGMIMATDLLARPFKAAVLLTDGVFYDDPKPKIVEKGFKYCESRPQEFVYTM